MVGANGGGDPGQSALHRSGGVEPEAGDGQDWSFDGRRRVRRVQGGDAPGAGIRGGLRTAIVVSTARLSQRPADVLWDSRPRQPHPPLTDEVITAHLVADDLAALGGTSTSWLPSVTAAGRSRSRSRTLALWWRLWNELSLHYRPLDHRSRLLFRVAVELGGDLTPVGRGRGLGRAAGRVRVPHVTASGEAASAPNVFLGGLPGRRSCEKTLPCPTAPVRRPVRVSVTP